MSAPWVPPRPTYHLRIFVSSLVLVALALIGMLFGVELESVVPATGTITARDLLEVRARLAGLVEPGWQQDGRAQRLQPGDLLQPGQQLAVVRDEALRLQLSRLEDQNRDGAKTGEAYEALGRERDRLRDYQAQGILKTPASGAGWLVLEVRTAPAQKVEAGDVIAVIVAADPRTRQPDRVIARLDVGEKHWAGVNIGAKVRLASSMYHPRLFGHAEAVIERLEPWGEPGSGGERIFHAEAPVGQAPFALPLGSTFRADIIAGKKPVYRIILEH